MHPISGSKAAVALVRTLQRLQRAKTTNVQARSRGGCGRPARCERGGEESKTCAPRGFEVAARASDSARPRRLRLPRLFRSPHASLVNVTDEAPRRHRTRYCGILSSHAASRTTSHGPSFSPGGSASRSSVSRPLCPSCTRHARRRQPTGRRGTWKTGSTERGDPGQGVPE